jgi:hypothetical protein
MQVSGSNPILENHPMPQSLTFQACHAQGISAFRCPGLAAASRIVGKMQRRFCLAVCRVGQASIHCPGSNGTISMLAMHIVNILGTIWLMLAWKATEKSIVDQLRAELGISQQKAVFLSYLIACLLGFWWGFSMVLLKAWILFPDEF